MKGVISIGSHHAQEHEGWVAEGVKYFIYFEPIKSSYEKMVRILPKFPNIMTFNMALGDFRGTTEMYVETEHQGKSCSILKPKLHLEQYPDIVFHSKESVAVGMLDDIQYDRSLYDHLHIDTQGYELKVLQGAKKSLEHIKTIQCEVYKEELYEGCPMISEVSGFLSDHGFCFLKVVWKSATWGDAQYVKLDTLKDES